MTSNDDEQTIMFRLTREHLHLYYVHSALEYLSLPVGQIYSGQRVSSGAFQTEVDVTLPSGVCQTQIVRIQPSYAVELSPLEVLAREAAP